MAQAVIQTINIFPRQTLKKTLRPRVVDIRDYWQPVVLGQDGSFGCYKKSLTIEFYCPVDQRELYMKADRNGKISSFLCGYDLKYLSSNNTSATKKSNNLNRLRIWHSPVMGQAQVNGKTKNVEVVEGGCYRMEILDGDSSSFYYAKTAKLRPFMQR